MAKETYPGEFERFTLLPDGRVREFSVADCGTCGTLAKTSDGGTVTLNTFDPTAIREFYAGREYVEVPLTEEKTMGYLGACDCTGDAYCGECFRKFHVDCD